jgi:hypothetical protein
MPIRFERRTNAALTFLVWLRSTVRRPNCFPSARARANPVITLSRICSLELSEHAEHLKHGATGRGRRIEPLLMQEQINALGMKVRQEAQQVRKGSTEPIHGPRGHHVDLTSRNGHHQAIKPRTFVATLGT